MKTKRSIFNGNVCKAMIAVASMVSLAFVSCAEDDFGNGSEKTMMQPLVSRLVMHRMQHRRKWQLHKQLQVY